MVVARTITRKPTRGEVRLFERGLPTDTQVQDAIAEDMAQWLSLALAKLQRDVWTVLTRDVEAGRIESPPIGVIGQKATGSEAEQDEWWEKATSPWMSDAEKWLSDSMQRAAEYQARRFNFYVDFRLINEAALIYARETWWSELIKLDGEMSIAQETRRKVWESVLKWQEGELGNRGLPDLRDEIAKWFSAGRAKRIAVTEATRVYAEGNRWAWLTAAKDPSLEQAFGIMASRWQTCRDGLVCPICAPLNGKQVMLNQEFPVPGGIPPAHVGCIMPGNRVVAPGKISAVYKSLYKGQIIELRLDGGGRLTITPNHPIYTPGGWVSAQFLREGDYVFHCVKPERIAAAIHPYEDHGPIPIEEVYCALLESPAMITARVPSTATDFHSDGGHINGDIHIVGTNRFLDRGFEAVRRKLFGQPELNHNRMAFDSFLRFGPLATLSPSCLPASGRFIRSMSKLLTFRDSHPLHPQSVGLGYAAGFDTSFEQTLAEGPSIDSSFARQFLLRFPGLIAPKQIVQVRDFYATNHVYDLQVDSYGLYIANGVIVKNCRCWITPIKDYNPKQHPRGMGRAPGKAAIERTRRLSMPERILQIEKLASRGKL